MLLRLRLLGTFEVTRDDGRALAIGSQGAHALLVYLALAAGRAHEREHLADLLWPDAPPEWALTNLRQAIHRLRLALPEETAALTVTRSSVRLDPAAIALDTDSFVAHLRGAAGHRHRLLWACDGCLAGLRAAIELYRGPLLPGFQSGGSLPYAAWLLERREWLHQGYLTALDALAAHHGARGEAADAIDYLRRWIAAERCCEEAHARQIGLLWRMGDRSSALRQYERCRAALAADLGREPAPATWALAEAIRCGAAPPPAQPVQCFGALPAMATPFVGRAAELARLGAHLADPDCRLVTLIGPAGIGKTRLAHAAAAAAAYTFVHGVVWVGLAAMRDDCELAATILAALGLACEQGRPAAVCLAEALAERELLLVLDTCEHLPRCASMAADLLRAAPGIVILATSRTFLGLLAERRLPLAGLPASDAGRLFVSAARRAAPSFDPGPGDDAAIAAICTAAEGSPLLIELAAAAAGYLSLCAIAHLLGANPDALRARSADLPARQRSPRAAFAWSWALLSESERALLADLALRGGLSVEAAASLDEARAADLDGLVRKALVRREAGGRYVLHGPALSFEAPRERAVG